MWKRLSTFPLLCFPQPFFFGEGERKGGGRRRELGSLGMGDVGKVFFFGFCFAKLAIYINSTFATYALFV